MKPDSLIPDPSNPQAFNRYAYVFNNPLKYTDPSGHDPAGNCNDKGYCDDATDSWADATKTTFVILACGVSTGKKCETGSYDNEQPLSDYQKWAEENGLGSEYFGFGPGDTIQDVQSRIEQFMMDNPILRFILIGHSAGADAVWNAALNHAIDNDDASRIRGVLLLDAGAMDIRRTDIDINIGRELIGRWGVDVKSFSSGEYRSGNENDSITLPYITQDTNIQTHYALAVDNAVLEQYTSPILNGWIYGP